MKEGNSYNERLDEILTTCDFEPEGFNSRICKWCGERKGTKIHTAKQAITSLIKELVAEAKPVNKQGEIDIDEPAYNDGYWSGAYNALEKFEQNLLKALEEV